MTTTMYYAIDYYDMEAHSPVVGATVDDSRYRKPILAFWREGDARLFCNLMNRYAESESVERQIRMLANRFEQTKCKLVEDFDYRIKDGMIHSLRIKRRKGNESE